MHICSNALGCITGVNTFADISPSHFAGVRRHRHPAAADRVPGEAGETKLSRVLSLLLRYAC